MPEILNPIIDLAAIFPGILLAYLPMNRHLRLPKRKLAAIIIPILVFLCAVGGIMSYVFNINTLLMTVPILIIIGIIYCRSLRLTRWKSISVILAVIGTFSCIASIANAINTALTLGHNKPWFCPAAGLIYNLICWIFVIISWYPATHAACELLEDENIAQTWYVFWILPVVFTYLNAFMIPVNPNILFQGRIMQCYIVLVLILLILLVLFYTMFYLIAKNLNRNYHLSQENQFLSMQQNQYKALCTTIEEIRQARHDMRHHFSALSVLASRKEWQQLEDYLAQVQGYIPTTDLNLCDNQAVDGVVGHYCLQYKENDIPHFFKLDLPCNLPISEMDMCLVLSNLLENSLEASLRTDKQKRYIKVQAYLHSENVVLITVENAYEGVINKKRGVFQSSKRNGDGVGIQSICRIAEKNGGYCKFSTKKGVFCANIMLRGENSNNH